MNFNDFRKIRKEKVKESIKIYTDGSCVPNPGRGGIGIIIRYLDKKVEYSFGYENSTNNRMELSAVIEALKILIDRLKVDILNDRYILIYSDSRYVVDCINNHWINNWRKNNWKIKHNDVKNKDLWLQLDELLHKCRHVEFSWVKGHENDLDNNRCDELAKIGNSMINLRKDIGYVKTIE